VKTQDDLLPLEFLAPNQWADVAEVNGDVGWVRRLAELGVAAGCRLCMLRPGATCLLQIGGCRLCLRGDVATQILVRPLAAG
jgi:Fe2+ transport system protein FeoA